MGENVEKLAAENALVGEGPVWDVESQTLYSVSYTHLTLPTIYSV